MTAKTGAGGASLPPYTCTHSGPVLVCGNAWCLHDDVERARGIYPDAPIIAVNGASGNVKAFALFSLHPQKFPGWIGLQKDKFGGDFTVHGCATGEKAQRNLRIMPFVDHWWEASAGGTSTWAARKMAHFMGFDLVVLCGMPLEKGGYQGGKLAKLFMKDEVIAHYRTLIMKDRRWHEGAVSMSGWTREILGGPDAG